MTAAFARILRSRLALAGILTLFLGLLGLAAPVAAQASPGQVTQFPAAGAQFTCSNGTVYTATGGLVHMEFHSNPDNGGGFHVSGNISLGNDVTATDGVTDNVYSVNGAAWFDFHAQAGGTVVQGDTNHFKIKWNGHTVGDVSGNTHVTINANGQVTAVTFKDTGSCESPEG